MSETIVALMQAGKWEDAIFACQTVLQLQPTNGKIHACLGESFWQLQRFKEAEPSFKRAYILDPSLWRAAVRHARCLERLHRYRESMDVVTEWLRVKPSDTDLLGLKEFLETQPESEEHDGWERTRGIGTTVINANFHREEELSVGARLDAEEAASDDSDSGPPAPNWRSPMKLNQNPGLG
ncbi:MAG TPA: tetratricopeptide repeat protein [Fimbriimonadaceae bacterium]|nr:tetratricopeptide repeat protein [Fimbriimonadaceae bacterium]